MAIAALMLRVGGVTVIEKAQATKALVLRAPGGFRSCVEWLAWPCARGGDAVKQPPSAPDQPKIR